jgi:thioredoxin-dependent peroxiredoxin
MSTTTSSPRSKADRVSVSVGGEAPDFELAGVDGATGEELTWRLSHYRGQPVVLVFYPADNSPVCTKQLESYTREIASFDELDAVVLALSPQTVESHREFASARGGFAFPLLADVDKAVAREYGVLGLLDLYRRCTFVIDGDGKVAWIHRYVGPGMNYRSADELVAAVAAAG